MHHFGIERYTPTIEQEADVQSARHGNEAIDVDGAIRHPASTSWSPERPYTPVFILVPSRMLNAGFVVV